MLDKIKGGLFGLAIGDALGGTTEFMTKEEIKEKYGSVNEFIGGGYWRLKPGETTDDTAMTVAVALGIMANSNHPIEEIGKRFLRWQNSDPKDIGVTIRTVFENYNGDWFKAAEEAHHNLNGLSAGNGSLMRCLPVVLAYSDKKKINEIATLQSKMTHFDDLAAEACVIYSNIALRLLEGEELRTVIINETKNTRYESSLYEEPDCPPDGYVIHTMKWVLHWLFTSNTFEEVVVGATNMGNDSDTIAAIAGSLKGLEVGFNSLPLILKNKLLGRNELRELANVFIEIRDKDTLLIQGNTQTYISDLEDQTNKLIKLNDQRVSYKELVMVIESIKKNVYLLRITLQVDDEEYEKKLVTWMMIENRYRRSRRLFDLGAPLIIIKHELDWLLTMIDHMNKRLQGIEPQFTEDQLEEFEMEASIPEIY